MATNFFFNNFTNSMEQTLIDDLVIESIKIFGQDMYYLPKTVVQLNKLYGEDSQASQFNNAVLVEMYIKNVEGFQGDGDFLSKFNIEIRDRMTLTIARRTFANEVGSQLELVRPREGDVVYFPLNRKFFQIKFVEHEAIFYQMGSLQTFDLVCELMEFSNEVFNTGIPDIDVFSTQNDTNEQSYSLNMEDGFELLMEDGGVIANENYNIETLDLGAQNETIQTASDDFLDFTEINPFSESRF